MSVDEREVEYGMDDALTGKRDKVETGDSDAKTPEYQRSPSAMSSAESSKSEKSAPPTWKSYVFLVILLGVYIGLNFLGALIFRVIERKEYAGKPHWFNTYKEEFVRNHSSSLEMSDLQEFLEKLEDALGEDLSSISGNETIHIDQWTIANGFLLSFTIASTIGYGVVTPVTAGGQAFCIIYALLSIPVTGLLAAKIGSLMAYFIKKAAAIIFLKRKKHPHAAEVASILFTFFVGLLIYIIIPTLLLNFVDNEENWTFIECLYCIFITMTTIGFGDYVPDPRSAGGMWVNIFVLIWVVAGLAWFATIVNLIATTLTKQATSIKKKVAHQKITVKSIKSATANLGGHLSGKKYRSKSSITSSGTGKSTKSNGKGSRPPSCIDEVDGEAASGNLSAKRSDSRSSKASAKDAWSKNTRDPNGDTTGEPAVVYKPIPDGRRESSVSKCSKRDEDLVLGPSGFLAVVINNMEDYGDGDAKEDDS